MSLLAQLSDRVARCLARYENQPARPALLVAASGGADSTALALATAQLAAGGRLQRPLALVHVDHASHPASRDAAAHVADLSARLGIGFAHARIAAKPSEEAWRAARYAALLDLARAHDAGFVLMGHHADDNLETILFRLIRGTGPRGLAGIPEHRALAPDVHVLRPFLDVRRATLHRAVAEAKAAVFADPTNADRRYRRNQTRAETLPLLRQRLGRSFDATLMALGRTAQAAARVVEAQARRLLRERSATIGGWRVEVDLAGLGADDDVFLMDAVRQLDERLRPGRRRPSRAWLERVTALRSASAGTRVGGGGDYLLAERTHAGLLLADVARAGEPPASPVLLRVAEASPFGTTEWRVSAHLHAEPPLDPSPSEAGRLRALLDPVDAPEPWSLRTRRPGERFRPLGGELAVDLLGFMRRRHVPQFDRDRWPLLVDAADRVLWVPALEIGAAVRVRPGTAKCIEVVATRS
jgi:tRNA(Ile)-lysidine synthase